MSHRIYKYLTISLIAAVMLICMPGCDAGNSASESDIESPVDNISIETDSDADIDLSGFSDSMTYSEIVNILAEPDGYVGKTIRMTGEFATTVDEDDGIRYFGCVNTDITECCTSLMEFYLKDGYKYPDDFPAEGEEITIQGTFHLKKDGQIQYCDLIDADIV